MSEPTPQLYIIIGGAGEVGYFLAKALIDAGHEVTLLDRDRRRVGDLEKEFSDAVVERGDACEARTLEHAGCARADYVLAVTGDDEDNLVMCQVAKARFNAKRTIARVNNIHNIDLFKSLGIDVVISPTRSILDAIQAELPLKQVVHVTTAAKASAELVELSIPADSPASGKPVQAIKLPKGDSIVLMIRNNESFVPDPYLRLTPGDKLFAVVSPFGERQLREQILTKAAAH